MLNGNAAGERQDQHERHGAVRAQHGAPNRPGPGYTTSVLEQFIWFGRNVDMNALKRTAEVGDANDGPDNREFNWNYNFHNNPYWLQDDNPLSDARDRVIASVSANYKMTDWLNASVRTGSDIYRYNINPTWRKGTSEQRPTR